MDLDLLASDDADATLPDDATENASAAFAAVPAPLRAALEARGFTELTAVQRAVLESEVEGRDLQISSQTGSGKTVALGFVLSARLAETPDGNGPEALIIVPTRELAAQVCGELDWLLAEVPRTSVASVTGGSPTYLDRKVLARRPRVLVGTPGRLLDHVSSGALDLSCVRELVLDEADQMLDMGFREELEGILDATPETRGTHLVSATFPAGIQRLAERYQQDPFAIEGTRLGVANQDIDHEGHFVYQDDRYDALVNLLLLAHGERTLVFVQQRAETVELAERLEEDGFAALPLSGELAQSQRVRTLAAFRSGGANVLVATDVAARGLDVPEVRMVIHTAPPIDAQVYTHRSGRTGRAGQRGRSVLLAPPSRRRKVTRLLAEAGIELEWRPVPGAEQVREEIATRARTVLQEGLDATLATGPADPHLAHAEELLSERDPVQVVAALLARLEPERRAEPRDVLLPQKRADGRRPERGPGERTDRDRGYRDRGQQERGYTDRGYRDRPRRTQSAPRDMVRFFVNWGMNQGANPRRILAAVCRRGEVTGEQVGSIAIHPNASTFDVHVDVAERFERLAGRRDPRDPHTRIRRDRGPQAGGGGRRP